MKLLTLLMTLFLNTLFIQSFQGAQAVSATNYYVSPSGKDTNLGTSMAQAFRTITKAYSKAQAGSTIFVQGGATVYYERIIIPISGTAAMPISLVAYGSDPVVISGAVSGVNSNAKELLAIQNRSNLIFRNIVFRDNYRSDASGIRVWGACSNLIFENCEVVNISWSGNPEQTPSDPAKNNAHGIWVKGTSNTTSSNIRFINCRVRDISPGFSEGFTIAGNVDGFLIQGATVFNIKNIGIDVAGYYLNPGVSESVNFPRNGTVKGCMVFSCKTPPGLDLCAGIYVDGAKNIVIEGNRSHQCQVAYSIGCETPGGVTENIYLRNSIGTNCVNSALYLGSSSNASIVRNLFVTNNTFVNNNQGSPFGTEIALFSNSNCTFKQNIVVPRSNQHYAFDLWNNPSVGLWNPSYNLFHRYTGYHAYMSPKVGLGSFAYFGDPKFVSTVLPYPNYHLTAGSAAINKGDPTFVPANGEVDIDGEARKQGMGVDIGADESLLSFLIEKGVMERGEEASLNKITVFPNPAQQSITVMFDEQISGLIQVVDAGGNMLHSEVLQDQVRANLSIEALPPGYYWIKTGQLKAGFLKL